MSPPPGERKGASRRSEGGRADHVDADHDLVADRGDAVRPGGVKRDAVAGVQVEHLVADLEPGVALEEQVGLLARMRAGLAGAGVAGLQLPDRNLERSVQRGGEELEPERAVLATIVRPDPRRTMPATVPSSSSRRNGEVPSASAMLRSVSSDGSSRPRSTWLSIDTETAAVADSCASVRPCA